MEKITNTRLQPLAFVSVQVKEIQLGTITKEDGSYELVLDEGKYDLVITMVGFQPQVVTIIIGKSDYLKNIILENDNSKDLSEVVVKGKLKDRAEEFIRNVIRHKDEILDAAGAYSSQVYIKAVQEDSSTKKKKKNARGDTLKNPNADLDRMAMAEIILKYDHESGQRTKEERTGVKRRGNPDGLFYLSTTEGDFNFYNNVLKVPAVSDIPIISPVSYSGLLAYKFKTLEIKNKTGKKIYVISVKPRQLSNATVEGEIMIEDSTWVILHTQFSFPKYHLPEYDFFEVEQNYELVNNKAWIDHPATIHLSLQSR
ncbi:MAG: DUF5686 family protein [Chitinophagaceae bacterium]